MKKQIVAIIGLIIITYFAFSQFLIREDIISKLIVLGWGIFALYAAIIFSLSMIKDRRKKESN